MCPGLFVQVNFIHKIKFMEQDIIRTDFGSHVSQTYLQFDFKREIVPDNTVYQVSEKTYNRIYLQSKQIN